MSRYHPDPVATGSAEPSTAPCSLCGRPAGLVCTGRVEGREPDGPVCLTCVEDGTASARLGRDGRPATFTDVSGPECAGIAPAVLDEVAHRTPGFLGWQHEHWLYHCGDAAAYLGRAGARELAPHPDAQEALLRECRELGMTPDDAARYLARLDADGDATAYLFRCLHCGTHLAYSDAA